MVLDALECLERFVLLLDIFKPVLRVFDGGGAMLHDYVYAFEPGYNGGIDVATTSKGSGLSEVLVAPARNHASVSDGNNSVARL